MGTSWWLRAAATLVALAVFAAGCGGGNTGRLETSGDPAAPRSASESAGAAPGSEDYAIQPDPEPESSGGLVHCEDVSRLESSIEGNIGGGSNVDDDVMGVVLAYRQEHPESHGGLWIDRENGGAIVLAVTSDAEAHRQEIQDKLSGMDAVIDVVQVEFPIQELLEIQDRLGQYMGPEFGLLSTATSESLNRVSLDFFDPPEGALKMFAELVDPAAVCANVVYSPEPPSGPLALIPDLGAEDPLVTCTGVPPVAYSALNNPVPIGEVDHPSAAALRTLLQESGAWELPDGDWHAIHIGADSATFAVSAPAGFGTARFERTPRDNWIIAGSGIGRPCEPVVALPEGLGRVAVRLDPDSLPAPEDTSVHLLVTEVGCASGREMGDALLGPQVIETGEAVLVAFAAISPIGPANCPGNPSTPVTVQLSQPLGRRTLKDGLHIPPKPLTVDAD